MTMVIRGGRVKLGLTSIHNAAGYDPLRRQAINDAWFVEAVSCFSRWMLARFKSRSSLLRPFFNISVVLSFG